MNYAVIMAGGTGKRLWPLSRRKRPKQVLKLLGGETLLGSCLKRLLPIFDSDKILVLTNAAYVDTVRENLPEIPAQNVIAEPCVRDTSGAVGLAAAILSRIDPDATMAVVTADQTIQPPELLQGAIKDALQFTNDNPESLITFGIQPTTPSTQYGYIKCNKGQTQPGCVNPIHKVDAFREKPDAHTAQAYLDRGDYFWNSGMFVWKAKTILGLLKTLLPETAEPLREIQCAWGRDDWHTTLDAWFPKLPKISIDFAVMEKAQHVHAIRLACDWLDLGSFDALVRIIKRDDNNNSVASPSNKLLDCHNNIIVTEDEGHLIAAIGMDDMIVAHSQNATLVCPISQAQRLKDLLEQLEQDGQESFL
jgi:mannose-1-phosphate guanylyltransferase